MEGVAFHKYEGLGNDFVLVEAEREDAVSAAQARALCDRRFGVGADGILLLLPPRTNGAAGTMRVINADGSIPEMCGNGLRCVVLHHALSRKKSKGEATFDTDAGPKPCSFDGTLVTVDMGVVKVGYDVMIDVDGEPWRFTTADAGNPHAITTQLADRSAIDHVGPRVSTGHEFPSGTNVEFATKNGAAIDLVVWERGVGVTHACGTGACATAAVFVAKGLVDVDTEVKVNLPGGTLFVKMLPDGHAMMRGPARHVFSGTLAR